MIAKLMPGMWPKTIMGLSIGLSVMLYKIYPDALAIVPDKKESLLYLVRLSIAILPILIGMALTLVFLIYKHNKNTGQIKRLEAEVKKLQEDNENLKNKIPTMNTSKPINYRPTGVI